MSNWQYAPMLPTRQFRSQNSLPRDLSLYTDDQGEYRVAVVPSAEAFTLRGNLTDQPSETSLIEVAGAPEGRKTVITLSNDKGEKVVMTLDPSKKTFSMNRNHSGNVSFSKDFPAVTTAPLFVHRPSYTVRLFIDRCSIEAFDGEGAWAMTNLVFPSEPYNRVEVNGGTATIYELNR